MKRFTILLIVLVLGGVDQVLAGAWTQPQGTGFYKLGTQWIRGQKLREVNGAKISIPTLADYTTSLYGEYGLRDRLTLIGYLPFKRITLNKQVGSPSGFVYFAGDDVTSIGDAQVGLRYALARLGASVLSAELVFGVPLGEDNQANGLLTGDGEANQRLLVQLGHSFYPLPSYVNVDFGFNNRVNGYSDELHYAVELGYTWSDKLTLILRARGIESRENGDDSVSGGQGGLYANDQSFFTYGPELIYEIGGGAGVALSAMRTGRARNALQAPVFSLGFFVKH